jgi:hypothetical protein
MELEKIPIYLKIIDHSYTIFDFIKELKKISKMIIFSTFSMIFNINK